MIESLGVDAQFKQRDKFDACKTNYEATKAQYQSFVDTILSSEQELLDQESSDLLMHYANHALAGDILLPYLRKESYYSGQTVLASVDRIPYVTEANSVEPVLRVISFIDYTTDDEKRLKLWNRIEKTQPKKPIFAMNALMRYRQQRQLQVVRESLAATTSINIDYYIPPTAREIDLVELVDMAQPMNELKRRWYKPDLRESAYGEIFNEYKLEDEFKVFIGQRGRAMLTDAIDTAGCTIDDVEVITGAACAPWNTLHSSDAYENDKTIYDMLEQVAKLYVAHLDNFDAIALQVENWFHHESAYNPMARLWEVMNQSKKDRKNKITKFKVLNEQEKKALGVIIDVSMMLYEDIDFDGVEIIVRERAAKVRILIQDMYDQLIHPTNYNELSATEEKL